MALHTVVITFVTYAPRQTIVDELTAHLDSLPWEYEIAQQAPQDTVSAYGDGWRAASEQIRAVVERNQWNDREEILAVVDAVHEHEP